MATTSSRAVAALFSFGGLLILLNGGGLWVPADWAAIVAGALVIIAVVLYDGDEINDLRTRLWRYEEYSQVRELTETLRSRIERAARIERRGDPQVRPPPKPIRH